ncbi:hypothetical protein [Demequina maris]|uniref:hypothetical protein n=1 Tax=Demequina maris TaxID=1638982 RepID=UPI0007841CAF|nr:hypothetical protein [Demequina maris]
MNDLDDLLALSTPPASADGPALDAAIVALIGEARSTATPAHTWRRRTLWAGLVAALVGIGGATAYATGTHRGEAWNDLTDEAEVDATRIEWMTTLPAGTTCVERLTGVGLTEQQVTAIESALANPDRLLALDGGAVRDEFLEFYDRNDFQQDLADRDTWESWIDAGYAAVAEIDLAAGRGALADEVLDVVPPGAENEIFIHTSMRLIIDGLTAQGIDAMRLVTPETACEAGE